ncbi:hypothetical protein [Kushneria indalinina]|uniref:Uncharacterized protein n=1 Tax=Kushneria indalinina DSM 14324 TaxID=1122140 RepID=A0A3D9DVM4_9GAMM|nr:hypothetical protein [Kushneria indalinina]REC94812.1 hypothetical protein C8D72_1640 [Kushneria indalinina DSM 14324]
MEGSDMTYAYKPATQDALDATSASETDQSFIIYDEETLDQEGIYASEHEAQRRCETLNRSATDNPGPDDVHPEQKM